MESCLRSCCYQEVWIHVTNQSPFQIQKRRMSGLVMDQAHMWVENVDRYGAWKLIGPHVAATKWCTHIYFLKTTPEGWEVHAHFIISGRKKKHIPGFNKNSLTSALYLSDYPTQGLSHQIWEVHRWVYCQPDQASIALIGCLEMVGVAPLRLLEFKDLQAEYNELSFYLIVAVNRY